MLERLKDEVCAANVDLMTHGLVTHTWGNVSGLSDDRSLVAIKPSGVAYSSLLRGDIVVVDRGGRVVDGSLKPSSDTATHLCLYDAFDGASGGASGIGGITHTHSTSATAFAQARVEIPCLGTTHADCFAGPVPLTRAPTIKETEDGYELNTGRVIAERFEGLDPEGTPGVLVAGHAPFCWGATARASVDVAVSLEAIAEIAMRTLMVSASAPVLEAHIREKHFARKHGASATYGQGGDA